jgi:uncharacterized protein (DUF1501 family)
MQSRRRFLSSLAGLPAVAMGACAGPQPDPRSAIARAPEVARATSAAGGRSVILIEMFGGNDGLNTLIPYRDPAYKSLRPTLAIPAADTIPVSDDAALHPGLRPLLALWERGEMAAVRGIGMADPNRSHFRAQEIWETASDSGEVVTEGWIARALNEHPRFGSQRSDAEAVVIGSGSQGAVLGRNARIVAMNDPRQYLHAAERLTEPSLVASTPALAHLMKTQEDALSTAATLRAKIQRNRAPARKMPGSTIGRSAGHAIALLEAGIDVPVFKMTLPGFDTHAGQLQRHDQLLKQLAECVAALRGNLADMGRWDETLIVAYSEFGRRTNENASGGTDHGTAGVAFLFGGQVAGGLHGQQPSLDALVDRDLVFAVDYRRLYATLLAGWWGQRENFLTRRGHAPLPLFRARAAA